MAQRPDTLPMNELMVAINKVKDFISNIKILSTEKCVDWT
jgi:hypothetical protein